MRMVIDSKAKIIELWLKNGEDMDGIIPLEVVSVISEYRNMRYLICIYKSGTEDLISLTSQLLISNIKEMAAIGDNR